MNPAPILQPFQVPKAGRSPETSEDAFRFEFRNGALRVFYRVDDDQVLVDAIGRKRGNQLFIGGTRVVL